MTTIAINIRDALKSTIGNSITNVSCSVDLEELLDFNDLSILNVDIHQLLAERCEIAIIWSIEDVQGVRPDLNEDQAWQVLQRCERLQDCELGFNWLLIETVADDLFPAPEKGDGQ